MKIKEVVLCEGVTGFYVDDQNAIKRTATPDGFTYIGKPVTKGFKKVREPGESVSVMLILEDGQISYGDCVTVQYPGVGGRDPKINARNLITIIKNHISPILTGKKISTFREMADEIDQLTIDGKPIHASIRYGVTQALLDAVAKTHKITMAEVIQKEYKTVFKLKKIKIFSQSGDNRYDNVDKMIMRKVDALPHGLINNVNEKLGVHGELLKDYIVWLRERILSLRDSDEYSPVIHIDVYGTIGLAFKNDMNSMIKYISELEKAASPFHLRLEGPVDLDNREKQWRLLKQLKTELKKQGILVEIVADEWCNSLEDIKLFVDEKAVDMVQIKTPDLGGINNIIEALLYCKQNNVGAYLGGSCNETEISSKVSVHISIACGADQCLAKPGMGVDEGYMIVLNEMNRTFSLLCARRSVISEPIA
ncbi:methylaspartate ammonia-lyase [Cytobacillus depressus]|uniref:methylaspartate ammonia-lyase n=1 Tax=Cytobacillus depressus TaxID=1602942 RepID=A0A6L3V5A0_9BACI|nr:methylaspartate ammonia-lyase [Cytobacillus depressus]KAB2336299.1 methylaspartate ammonia-lyase [Cytobacillus depressus]